MSLTIEPKKGIRLSLDQYSAIKTWQGGGKFWEHDFQLTVRQGPLHAFLPRVTDEGGAVLYEQVVEGREAVSESVASSSRNPVPASQIRLLRQALAELKAKAEDPHCDANKRRMIEAFRLPDPQKDAELYRLYGSGRRKRLLVLWGVEKEVGSAIAPMKALERMPSGTNESAWLRWLLLLLLLILAAAVAWILLSGRGDRAESVRVSEITPSGLSVATKAGTGDMGPSTDSAVKDSKAGLQPNPAPPASFGGTNPENDGRSLNASPSRSPLADSGGGDVWPSVTPKSVADAPVPSTQGSNDSPISRPSASPPTNSEAPRSETSAFTSPASPLVSHTPVASPAGSDLPDPSNPVEPPVAATGATRMKISAVPQGETTGDQLTVILSATGQNDQGALVSDGVKVTRWTIDGNVQRAGNGLLQSGAALPVTLSKGIHHVCVEGETGVTQIRSEADVDVSLKLTTQTAVTVTPR